MIILISIVAVLFAVLAIRKFDLALMVLFVSLPLYIIRFNVWNIPSTLLELLILITFVAAIIKFKPYKSRGLFKNIPFKWPLLLFVIASIFSLIISPQLREALGVFKAYIIEAMLVYFVLVFLFKTKDKEVYLKSFFWGLGISVLYLSLYAIVQKFTGIGLVGEWAGVEGRRVSSILGYPNSLSLFLSPLIPAFFVLALNNKILPRVFSWTAFLAGSLALFFTVSEGGMGAAIVGTLLGLFICGYRRVSILIVIVVAVIVLSVPALNNQVASIFGAKDVSTDVRLQIWKGTVRMIKAHPLLGVGLRGFEANYSEYKEAAHTEVVLYPHNIFMNFWTETGVLGLISIVWLFGLIYKQNLISAIKNKETLAIVSVVFFTALIIHGLLDVPFFKNDLAVLFMMGVAIAGFKKY